MRQVTCVLWLILLRKSNQNEKRACEGIDNLFFEYDVNGSKGKGHIIDISTSGCAVDSLTIPLQNDAEILITLNFDEHPPLSSIFTIKAHVVRANDQVFATQFLDFDDEHKEQLYKRVAYEVSRSTHLR